MATKLKNLKVTKVDFVDEGANPDAHIKLYKSKDGVEPPTEGKNSEKGPGFWAKLVSFIGKAANMEQDEIDSAMDEIQKSDAVSFNEKFSEAKNRKIADEIWDICYALESSLCSILNDEELDSTSAQTAMQESLKEFNSVMSESISQWSSGKAASIVMKNDEVTETDIDFMKSAVERLQTEIEKACGTASKDTVNGPKPTEKEKSEGDEEEMKVDKSKMTPAERAFYEDLEKRYAMQEAGEPNEDPAVGTQAENPVAKSVSEPQQAAPTAQNAEETPASDDIYKGLHPAVRAEMESLRKFREDAENRELLAVAKKYEIIGKKPEELAPVLKSLKEAGGTAYDEMIAVLDSAVATVEQSGAFQEIGKSGHGSNENSAWAKAEAKATEIMKSKPGISRAEALDEVLMSDPVLAAECEKED